MAHNKKPRKPYRPPAELPAPVAAKRKADQANAYVKALGSHWTSTASKSRAGNASQHGIQGRR